MKKIIGLILMLAVSGCSKPLSEQAKQDCQRFSEQMDSYVTVMRNDPSNAKANFEAVYSAWLGIRDSIPSSDDKDRIENALALHRLVLTNVSFITLYVKTPDGMEVPDASRKQWEIDCQQIHREIDKKYFKYLSGRTEGLSQPKEVKKVLEDFVSAPTALCPSGRMMGNPQIINEIVTLNLDEGTKALNQLTK